MKIEDLEMLLKELSQERTQARKELNTLMDSKPDFSSLTALLNSLENFEKGKLSLEKRLELLDKAEKLLKEALDRAESQRKATIEGKKRKTLLEKEKEAIKALAEDFKNPLIEIEALVRLAEIKAEVRKEVKNYV